MESEIISTVIIKSSCYRDSGCVADIGKGEDWATIYSIISGERGKGHASELMTVMKKHYELEGKKFGSSVALSASMKHLLAKLNIEEYA